jgi:peroxiredoxin family protein
MSTKTQKVDPPMIHIRLHPDLRQKFKVIACQRGMSMQAIGESLIEEFVSSLEDIKAA